VKIENVNIDSVIPYANNPRNNSDAVDKVAASIQAFGWQQPIVVDENMVVIVGHTRLLAAKKLGFDEVPVQVADKLTAEQAKAYRLADNRVSEEATWDRALLGIELRELDDLNFDLDVTGFTNVQLSNLLLDPDLMPDDEWEGMPAFNQENKEAFRTIIVHFKNEEDVNEFRKLMSANITEKTRAFWFPFTEIESVKDRSWG
tara:strand:- start:13247 stop:13852 length:606 start_codon:yes stop_codon:yes gene_type:complete